MFHPAASPGYTHGGGLQILSKKKKARQKKVGNTQKPLVKFETCALTTEAQKKVKGGDDSGQIGHEEIIDL